MLLCTVYTVTPHSLASLTDLDLPLNVQLATSVRGTLSAREDEQQLRLRIERRIDVAALELVAETGWRRRLPDGLEVPVAALRLRDDEAPEHILAMDLVSAIAFLTDVALSLSRAIQDDRFVPESEADRAALEKFGTDKVYHQTVVMVTSRTFGGARVTPERIQALLPRRVGLRLYADAIKLGLDVAQFRELWRVLESAFDRQGEELVAIIAQYPPAQAMGFTNDELHGLLVLRGRASHAASKGGLDELVAVMHQCGVNLTRLKSLVERVISTKASWGYPTLRVNELLPAQDVTTTTVALDA
jgi:hypothetical protein